MEKTRKEVSALSCERKNPREVFHGKPMPSGRDRNPNPHSALSGLEPGSTGGR